MRFTLVLQYNIWRVNLILYKKRSTLDKLMRPAAIRINTIICTYRCFVCKVAVGFV